MDSALIIDNTDCLATGGGVFERRNPVTGEIVTRAAAATAEDAVRAVQSAAAAFPAWSKTGPNQRRDILLSAAQLLDERGDQFVESMIGETGASMPSVKFNVKLASGMMREAAAIYDEAQMPLGGMKASGYGRFGGHGGISECTEMHWVSVEDPEQRYPIWSC